MRIPVGNNGNHWLLALALRIPVVIGQKVKESNDEMDESLYPPWSRTDRLHWVGPAEHSRDLDKGTIARTAEEREREGNLRSTLYINPQLMIIIKKNIKL
ncbi:hypothetical protein BDW71DRAFT_9569 [Aspergillus fruticulosus]